MTANGGAAGTNVGGGAGGNCFRRHGGQHYR
jgi:hypothetical protein